MIRTFEELKKVARKPENSSGSLDKGSALIAISAIRALQQIADMPIGKNPLAEAQAMRDIARSVAGYPAEERDRD